MRRGWITLLVVLSFLPVLAGCAGAYGQGRAALRQGHYAEAATEFDTALKDNPERLDALAGRGISRYKLGAYDEAVEDLTTAVSRAPSHADAQLYLGLSYLQKGEDAQAAEHLRAFRDLYHHRRFTEQIDSALQLLHGDRPLSTEIRRYIAVSLENAAKAEREVQEAEQAYAVRRSYYDPFWGPRYFGFVRCFPARHGRFVCF